MGDRMRACVAVCVGQCEGDGVGLAGYESQQLEFVRALVLRFLICGACEVGISVRVHGIADGDGVIGGEIHIQRRGVGAVRVLFDEDVVFRGRGLAFLGLEIVVGHVLIVGGVYVFYSGVEPFDTVLTYLRLYIVVAQQACAQRDGGGDECGGPASGPRVVRQYGELFHKHMTPTIFISRRKGDIRHYYRRTSKTTGKFAR